jgi:uncharacterized membrane protein YhaH (DUF805 family)
MKGRHSVLKVLVAPIVAVVVFIPTLAIAVREVLHGRGAATYSNFYGLAIPYTSVLILVLVVVLTIAVAYVARLVYFWRSGHDGSARLRKIDTLASSLDSDERK